MARHTKKGRSKGGGRFVALHHFMLDTPAWLSLSPAERVTYVYLVKQYDGTNNGALRGPDRGIAEDCNINRATAARAKRVLEERGFIELATPGGFSRKVRHASEYRLTFHQCDLTGAVPSKAFQKWRPLAPQAGQGNANRGPTSVPSQAPQIGQCDPDDGLIGSNEGPESPVSGPPIGSPEGPHIDLSHGHPVHGEPGEPASDYDPMRDDPAAFD